MVGRGSVNNIILRSTTFDQMKNTGILYEIKEPNLLETINEYYDFAKVEIEKLNTDNQEFYKYVLNTSSYEYINVLTRVQYQKNIEYVDWSWLKDTRTEKYQKFESRISFHIRVIEENRKLIKTFKEKGQNVLDVIKH